MYPLPPPPTGQDHATASMDDLTRRELAVLDRHEQLAEEGSRADSTVEQWEGHYSTFRAKTGKLWVYRLRKGKKVAKQELIFYSTKSTAGTLTCSHAVKLLDLRRKLTPRETARLQGFPDEMILPERSYNKLFGNAVCVPCAVHALSRVCGVDERLRHLDLCAGIGGFSFALKTACPLSETVGYSDVFPPAEKCYAANFPRVPRMGDATLVSRWPPCDLLTAGFPCQPFSSCNTSIGKEDHKDRDFYKFLLTAIEESGATRVVLENVVAFRSDKKRFGEIVDFLRDRSFSVSHAVLDASRFGVPQTRKRVYIMASKLGPPLDVSSRFLGRHGDARPTIADILEGEA